MMTLSKKNKNVRNYLIQTGGAVYWSMGAGVKRRNVQENDIRINVIKQCVVNASRLQVGMGSTHACVRVY